MASIKLHPTRIVSKIKKNQYTRHRWQEIEIVKMRELYDKKTLIKEIAYIMGRTPTAVNKALDRFNIRQKKDRSAIKPRVIPQRRYFKETSRKRLQKNLPVFISFIELRRWLMVRGHSIQKVHYPFLSIKELFLLDCQLMQPFQMLMLANKLRIKAGQAISHVDKITYFDDE